MSNPNVPTPRNLQADYKAAMIEEYQGYVRAGRDDAAAEVAAELKLTFGHDVSGKADKCPEPEPPIERAVPDKDEAETPEKSEAPVKRGPGRPRKVTE